ncbi:MAG TPA: PepSY domain-containing protein, partial [Gemmatimonadaceae bacterium]|nr:PepSY domain-containing protein [Gemmatimonadaceae bacterium]
GTIKAVELERENGHLQYSYDVTVAGQSGITEVNVDAMTGTVLGVHRETAADEAKEAAAEKSAGPGYHVAATTVVGGDGGWDYVAFDAVGHRLFVARQTRVQVLDPATGKLLGEIPGLARAHGIAFADAYGHGFASSGTDSTVVMFDLKTLQVLGKATAALDADAILFDPASKHVFSFNGDSKSASVFDPSTGQNIGTIDLGAGPEFAVSAGDGRLYVNLEDAGAVAEIDATTMKVTRRWSIAPCKGPTGLAMDRVHRVLFSGCAGSKMMAISDATNGKLLTTLPIGAGVDATGFDPETMNAFSSNGDGTLTVIHEDSPTTFSVAETVKTMPSARTMALDPATHTVYTVGAKFGPAPAAGKRPPMLPGTFTLLVLKPGT